jgi:hypothetical protein
MKIQVIHDAKGNIFGVLASPPGERRSFILPQGIDRSVTEVDIPEINLDITQKNQDQVVQALDKVITGSRLVSGHLVRAKQGN